MIQLSKKRLVICLCGLCSLMVASDFSQIPLPFGDFENLDIKTLRKTNRVGGFILQGKGWKMASKGDVASGENALTIVNTMTLNVPIPPKLRGYSLKLTFQGKGKCNFKVDFTEHQTDEQGKIIRKLSRKMPVSTSILPKTTYADYQDINCYTPPLSPKTSQVSFSIKQRTEPFHVDDFKLTAFKTPFFFQGKPVLLPENIYALHTGKWEAKHPKAQPITDEKGVISKIQIWHGPPIYLPLPLEQLRNKWLALAITARGDKKVAVELQTGTTGKAVCTFHSPDILTPDYTVMHVWFHPAGSQADDLRIMLKPTNLAEIIDVKIYASDTPLIPHMLTDDDIKAGRLPKEHYLVGAHPSHPGLVDVAPYARLVHNYDYVPRRNDPIDGILGSGTKLPLIMRFPKPLEISEIRLTLPYTHMTIWGDTKGNGVYDTLIAEHYSPLKIAKSKELRHYVWFRKKLEKPLKLHGLYYRNAGYGQKTYECQILATPQAAKTVMPSSPNAKQLPVLTYGDNVTVPPCSERDRLHYGFTLEAWMFDVPNFMRKYYKDKSFTIPPVKEWKSWQNLLKDFKSLHANFILLFPPDTTVMPPGVKARPAAYPAPLMWESKVWYISQPFNFLKMITDSCRENGIKLYAIPRAWLFKKGLKDGPVGLAQEITRQGAHGAPICVDEHYYYLKDPKVNSLEERKNYLGRLEKIADTMRKIKEECTKINPHIETFGGFSSFYHYKDRLYYVSPHDMWGFEGKGDIIGGDAAYFTLGTTPFGSYTPVVGCKEYASLSPGRRVMATQNFNWWAHWNKDRKLYNWALVYDDYPSVAFYGGALSCFFSKAESLNFWRYNFIDAWGGPAARKAIGQGGRMVEVLSAWGGKAAQIPKDVMILRSRTGEDWWNLKIKAENPQYKTYDDNFRREFIVKRMRRQGWSQFNWCITQLLSESIPHEIYMLNRPQAWEHVIEKFKVVVMPFNYAISKEAVKLIDKAAQAGVRIIALTGGGLGTVDDMGEPHPAGALLQKLVDQGKVRLFDIDVINRPSDLQTDNAFKAMLTKALAERGGPAVTLNRTLHHDVHCHMLECSPREKLVLLVNYSERDTAVTLGVNLPEGMYRLEVCRPDSVTKGLMNGKTVFTAAELRQLRIQLPREDTQIIRVLPVGD